MLEWLWHILAGWVEVFVPLSDKAALLDMLWKCDISFWQETVHKKENRISVRIFQKELALLQRTACDRCVSLTLGRQGGIPELLRFCKVRPGLFVGTICLLLWCLYAEHIIWRVEIDGCSVLSERAVQEILASHGCGIGDYIPAIDCDALHATIKAEHPEIAWISVYLHGNTAEVQLRETKFSDEQESLANTYANVVAAEAGEIVSVRVYEGESVVSEGDVVMPGELLVSGVVSMKNEGESRLKYAAGEVLAKVARPLSISVTHTQETTAYTGRKITKRTVTILGKAFQLYWDTDIPYAEYDEINTIEAVQLFGKIPIPVTISTTTFWETETIFVEYTAEEAVAEAMGHLRKEIDAALANGELLERTVTTAWDEDGTYRIECLLYLLQDIAKTEEFTVQELPLEAETPF